jgi:hypothetical protein
MDQQNTERVRVTGGITSNDVSWKSEMVAGIWMELLLTEMEMGI